MTGSRGREAVAPRMPWHDRRGRIPARAIREYAGRIAARFQPQRIILFGSYARGDHTPDSDVDLLIVMESRGRHRPSRAIRQHVPCQFPVDLIVLSEKRLRQRVASGDCMLAEAVAQGKTVYEAGNRTVG